MKPHVGFYVHHHGRGHLARTEAVLKHLQSPATVLTSASVEGCDLPGASVLELPLDLIEPGEERGTPLPALFGLHHAPVGCAGLRTRTARIAAWAEETRPSLLVVDVSVEVAVLGRLLSLPVVTVRQHGLRTDAPHLLGYGVSAALLAPYPADMEDPSAPEWVVDRTFYAGGFSRHDGRELRADHARRLVGARAGRRQVVTFLGTGGVGVPFEALRAAALACPHWDWTILGRVDTRSSRAPDNLRCAGWVSDAYPYLRAADVVVSAAGHNGVMEVAAARRPLVCVPEDRPFGEQHSKAELLRRRGAAVVRSSWPSPEEWPDLLTEARKLGADSLAGLVDGGGASRAAAHLDRLARSFRT